MAGTNGWLRDWRTILLIGVMSGGLLGGGGAVIAQAPMRDESREEVRAIVARHPAIIGMEHDINHLTTQLQELKKSNDKAHEQILELLREMQKEKRKDGA